MKPVGGLPDTRESLSSAIPSQEIAAANKEVQKESESAATRAKRGPYKKYSAVLRLEITKHASQHGAAATARYYSRKLEKKVSESAVKSIKKVYVEELRKRPRADDREAITALPTKKFDRRFLLSLDVDQKVQIYLKKVRDGGGAISARIAVAAARGILLKCNRSMLAEFGGPVQLSRTWATHWWTGTTEQNLGPLTGGPVQLSRIWAHSLEDQYN